MFFFEREKKDNFEFSSFSLSESETKTTMHIFSDHAGVVIDPFGTAATNRDTPHATAIPDLHGVRISPKQSPNYEPMVNKQIELNFNFIVAYFLSLSSSPSMVQQKSIIHLKQFIQHGGNLIMKVRRKEKGFFFLPAISNNIYVLYINIIIFLLFLSLCAWFLLSYIASLIVYILIQKFFFFSFLFLVLV